MTNKTLQPFSFGNMAHDFAYMAARNAVQADRHVAAEWQAYNAGRAFSVFPRGWEPLGPRPNGTSLDDNY